MHSSEKIDDVGNQPSGCRRPTVMIRSRRFAFAALVVVLGLSACGDPSTTTPLADQPKVIQLASGQAGGAAPTAASATAEAADSKMAYFGATEFVYDGELPA